MSSSWDEGPNMWEARKSLLDDYSDHGDDDDDDGPYGKPAAHDPKIRKAQSQANEVLDIMRTNMGKVLDRSAKLDDLEDKSEKLSDGAVAFKRKSRRMTWLMWWQNMRWKIVIALVVLAILLIIFVPIIVEHEKKKKS